jgi:hypothetical protein
MPFRQQDLPSPFMFSHFPNKRREYWYITWGFVLSEHENEMLLLYSIDQNESHGPTIFLSDNLTNNKQHSTS